jgi:hypothetical protein
MKTLMVTDLISDVTIRQPMFLEIAWVDKLSESDFTGIADVGDECLARHQDVLLRQFPDDLIRQSGI